MTLGVRYLEFDGTSVGLSRLYTIGGLERWTGLVDWTTGLTDFQSEKRRGAPETL